MVPMRPSWTSQSFADVNVNYKHAHKVYETTLFLWDRQLLVYVAGDAAYDPVQNLMGGELE